MGVHVIDVSRWQGVIDWPIVARHVGGAWIKVGGADDGLYRDSRATANLAGAQAAGVRHGTYYFAHPTPGKAVEQARHAHACGHGTGELWPAVDVETNPSGLAGLDLDRWVSTFCAETLRLSGRRSVVYTNLGTGLGRSGEPPPCPLWIANYGSNRPGTAPPTAFRPKVPPAWERSGWSVWQFNSETSIPGVAGIVDQNVVTDEFWEQMTAPAAGAEEDDMARPIYRFAAGINHPNARYRVIDLRHGVYPRPGGGVDYGWHWYHTSDDEDIFLLTGQGEINPDDVHLLAAGNDGLDRLYERLPWVFHGDQISPPPPAPPQPAPTGGPDVDEDALVGRVLAEAGRRITGA